MKKKQILIVEDESIIAQDIKKTLELLGYYVLGICTKGEEAIKYAESLNPDLILMDMMLKGNINGIETTKQIVSKYNIPVIYLTTYSDESNLQKIKSTKLCSFIQKPFKESQLKEEIDKVLSKQEHEKSNAINGKNLILNFNRVSDCLLGTIVKLIEVKSTIKEKHISKVIKLSCEIAKELGLSKEQIEGIGIASTLQNIGELYIPAELLSKTSKLDKTELNLIKNHPQIGYNILKEIDYPYPIAQIVHQHHERLDGSGYPLGLIHNEIKIEAKIIAVADVFIAMCSNRPYRKGLNVDKVLKEIYENKGILFDSQVVDACLTLFKRKGLILD